MSDRTIHCVGADNTGEMGNRYGGACGLGWVLSNSMHNLVCFQHIEGAPERGGSD
jgi:hypothetical protein